MAERSPRGLTDIAGHLAEFYLSVLGNARRPLELHIQEEDMEDTAWDHLKWYSKISTEDKQHLIDFLLRLDQCRRVDPEAPTTIKMRQDITQIMESLVDKIQELEPRFKGRLVPMGSSHNNTKIGDSDEFDFAYEMDVNSLLSGQATFEGIEKGELRTLFCLDTKTCIDDMTFFQFPENPRVTETLGNDTLYYRTATLTQGDDCVLNIEHIAFGFYLALYNALSMMNLPPGWSHGGFNRPNFSGIRFNLPSFLLQFQYSSKDRASPLQLSVDFAPVLKFPAIESDFPDLLNAFLKAGGYMTSSWKRLQGGKFKSAFYSQAEEKFLSAYSWKSIPKTLLRLCKALHGLAKLSAPKYIPQFLFDELKEFYDHENDSDASYGEKVNLSMIKVLEMVKLFNNRNLFLIDDTLATYEDLGECGVGEYQYVSSYTFKRTVMTLMALDEDKGHSWTVDDLPDLIMSVYTFINDVKVAVNPPALPLSTLVEWQTVSVTLDELPRDIKSEDGLASESSTTEPSPSESRNKAGYETCSLEGATACASSIPDGNDCHEEVVPSQCDPPKFYTKLKSALLSDKCEWLAILFRRPNIIIPSIEPGLDIAITQVFQILKAASEGKKTAEVVVWREHVAEGARVTKQEIKSICRTSTK